MYRLKCNRSAPCDNCTKRGDAGSCTYASPAARRRNTVAQQNSEPSTPVEMQSRINRLENLVLSLMGNGNSAMNPQAAAALAAGATSPSTSTSEPSQLTPSEDSKDMPDEEMEQMSRSIGVLKVQNDRQFYASEAHWWTILSDIAEVKRYFLEHQKQYDEQVDKIQASKQGNPAAAVSLLFRGAVQADRETLLSNFPDKVVADLLMQRHFNTEGTHIHILHGPQFRKQYDRHWAQPDETPVPWLGMCYAMMSLSLESYHRAGDEPTHFRGRARELAIKYSESAAQCLVTADFTQPLNFMLEALCFYFQAEYARSRDAETGLWLLSGIISRLAMRMGLQRDSAPYAILSPFKGEMRRRVWGFIRTTDILLSFQCGLPNMIRSSDTDTALPSNYYDEDLDEDASTLPTPRPPTENTTMSFMIAHTQMVFILGRIQELSMSLVFPSHEATMKMDAELRENRAQLPNSLRMDVEHSSIDPAIMVMQRFALDLTYHKSQCLLHRKFLALARRDSRYFASRKTCIESCLDMLAHQSTLQIECQPTGRLSSLAWSFTTSLTTHDFLLSAMIVCLDLYHTAQAEAQGQTSGEAYEWAVSRREAMFAAIERAVAIWDSLKDQSMEAWKASTILRVMLDKLRNHQSLRQQMQNSFKFTRQNDGVSPDASSEHSAAITLGMLSSGGRLGPDGLPYDPKYIQGQRTGLTPQPPFNQMNPLSPGYAQVDGTASFSNLFNGFGPIGSMELPNANLDWVSCLRVSCSELLTDGSYRKVGIRTSRVSD